jgi:hypothetical protein
MSSPSEISNLESSDFDFHPTKQRGNFQLFLIKKLKLILFITGFLGTMKIIIIRVH